ncbi:rap1 GTPase-activating protein 1-like isoform X2 [Dendronephthya gigantea]|uniref:rap1 GTPase-activating protein 1-like isoform X2 n=1 Tax=Dendronephthya gigantea TaxID=151771 RepID=UPI001069C132|nr:rap1 GTPase-activating protein 1-like isoform X2 [Dendronephthya gigantea]
MDLNNEEFFKYLSRLQSDRLDEQRCPLSQPMAQSNVDSGDSVKKSLENKEPIDEVLLAGKPYPLVVLPVTGEYWQEGTNHMCDFDKRGKHIIKKIDEADLVIEDDMGYSVYKNFFKNKEHFNFTSDSPLGSLLLSLKFEENCPGCDEKDGDIVRIILRSVDRTIQGAITTKNLPSCPGPRDILKEFVPDLLEDFTELQFQPVIYPKASSQITRFDEHGHAEKFKVGVIYQRAQQTSERQFFCNKSHSKAMNDFLQILGEEVELFGFKGYSGGLDTKNHQTGRKSVYTKYKGREIMFHVSTLLPYTSGDAQQLQRKRHIGNDIIAIIFQDENTPFSPCSIRSSFLHIFIVVQVEEAYSKNTRYKITVTAKEDVPEFGPSLPNPAVFSKNDPHLRDFLLTKLLNAELAAFKAKQFSTLMERTRKLLFEDLVTTLAKKSQEILSQGGDAASGNQSKGKILHSLRNAFRSESLRGEPSSLDRETTQRSKSLENLVHDDELDKTTKKKRPTIQMKSIRPKSKSMFHAPPMSAVDTAEARDNMLQPEGNDGDVSPTFGRRDESPSGSFQILDMDPPKLTSSATERRPESPEIIEPSTPDKSETEEATSHHKKLNGLIPSPRNRKKMFSSLDRKSPARDRKVGRSSTEPRVSLENKVGRVGDENLIMQLRGDLYKLSNEKARLKRENDALREDMKSIKEAMLKQAEDLCESQYQLNLLLENSKLPASAV